MGAWTHARTHARTYLGGLVLVVPAGAERRAQLVLVLRQPCHDAIGVCCVKRKRTVKTTDRRPQPPPPIPALHIPQKGPKHNNHNHTTPPPNPAPLTTVAAISRSEQKKVSVISQYFSANFCIALSVAAAWSSPDPDAATPAAPPAFCGWVGEWVGEER